MLKRIMFSIPSRVFANTMFRCSNQKHTLVPALKVRQQLFCFRTVGGKVGRNDVHVISGTNSLFLLLDLALYNDGFWEYHGKEIIETEETQWNVYATF